MKRHVKNVTPELVDKMQELRDKGCSMDVIARQLGVSHTTVSRYTVSKDKRRTVVTEELINSMQADRDSGLTIEQICDKYNVCYGTVSIYTYNNGTECRGFSLSSEFAERFTKEWDEARFRVLNAIGRKK